MTKALPNPKFENAWNPSIAEQKEWLNDYYDTAKEQKPKLTILWYPDGTDEFIAHVRFFQTDLPNNIIGRAVLLIRAIHDEISTGRYHFPISYILRHLFDRTMWEEVPDSYRQHHYCNYAFAVMTECEAEIMCNVEAHLDVYEHRTFYLAPDGFSYPPLTDEDDFHPYSSFFRMIRK